MHAKNHSTFKQKHTSFLWLQSWKTLNSYQIQLLALKGLKELKYKM